MSEVVLTGAGVVTAAGAGVEALADALRTGRTCLSPLDDDLAAGLAVRFGGRAPRDVLGEISPADRVLALARPALEEALAAAGLEGEALGGVGLTVGSGLGAMERTEACLAGAAPGRLPGRLLDLHPHAITQDLADRAGLAGPRSTTTVTCASALYAFEQACGDLLAGRAAAMVTGGLETLSRTILAGFCALDALSKTAGPKAPSANDGIVLGEGACFVVVETPATAHARGARVLARVSGRGLRTDGVHMTSPDVEGRGMRLAVIQALDEAGLRPEQVERISLTAPASPAYAQLYRGALDPLFGADWAGRATTWEERVGHVLGASGALGLLHGALHLAGELGAPPAANVLALTVGFGGLNGATVLEAPPGQVNQGQVDR